MKRFFTFILLICSAVLSYAYTDFVADGIAYSINSDGKTVSVTNLNTTGWNWKSWNNYEDVTIEVPPTVSNDDVTYEVTAIGSMAFSNSHNLTSVTLPTTIKKIESYAFSCCDKLTELILPDGLEVIEGWTFFNCRLNKLVIPPSLKTIGGAAFYSEISGGGATNVYITDLSAWLKIDFKDESSNPTKMNFFLNDEPIVHLVIPDDITIINNNALKYVDCESVIVPNHVTSIGNYAFYGCKAETIIIGDGVKTIGSWALSYCSYKTIELGANVETIETPNFNNIPNFTTVICHSITPPVISGGQAFTYFHGRDDDEDDYNLATKKLIITQGAKDAYINAYKWKEFGTIIENAPTIINESTASIKTEETTYYNLQGQLLQYPTHGLYIVNGKKVFIK